MGGHDGYLHSLVIAVVVAQGAVDRAGSLARHLAAEDSSLPAELCARATELADGWAELRWALENAYRALDWPEES